MGMMINIKFFFFFFKLFLVLLNSLGFMQQLHEDLPSSTLIQIPECGHLPHVEKPDHVAKLIVEFSTRDSTQKKIEVSSS